MLAWPVGSSMEGLHVGCRSTVSYGHAQASNARANAQTSYSVDRRKEGLSNNIVGDLEQTTSRGWDGESGKAYCAYVDDAWTVTGCKTATGSSTVNTVRQDQNWLRKQSIGNISTDRIENCVVCFDEDAEPIQRVRTLNVDSDDQVSIQSLAGKAYRRARASRCTRALSGDTDNPHKLARSKRRPPWTKRN